MQKKLRIKYIYIFLLSSVFLLISWTIKDPIKIKWADLGETKYKTIDSTESGQSVFYKPIFPKKIKKLAGESVQLTGYVLPLTEASDAIILSATPHYDPRNEEEYDDHDYTVHFHAKIKFENLQFKFKLNEYQTFKGILELYPDRQHEYIFHLKNAELVKN